MSKKEPCQGELVAQTAFFFLKNTLLRETAGY